MLKGFKNAAELDFSLEENKKKLLAEREYKIKNLKETIENAQKELKKLEHL